MITKRVTYKLQNEYLFLDQKRKLKLVTKMKKNIVKFDLKPEYVGFCNPLVLGTDF